MNLGRTWKIKERYALNVRAEFSNIFNRAFWNNPTATNARPPRGARQRQHPVRLRLPEHDHVQPSPAAPTSCRGRASWWLASRSEEHAHNGLAESPAQSAEFLFRLVPRSAACAF